MFADWKSATASVNAWGKSFGESGADTTDACDARDR